MSDDRLGEFDQIKAFMAPLTKKANGAFALGDDGAAFSAPAGEHIVVSTDTLIAGVHFIGDEAPQDIAHKVMAVNLSDLAAMGAKPLYYTLNAAYTADISSQWIEVFAHGLKDLQDTFDVHLLGGDTTRTPGPLTFSLTAFGSSPPEQILRRNGARAGDLLCCSGTIGDAALGLKVAQNKLPSGDDFLLNRYRRPTPRVDLGLGLRGIAHACMDVSDGLLGDLRHMCEQSNCGAVVDVDDLPVSESAHALIAEDSSLISSLLGGGDDYELLFAISEDDSAKLAEVEKVTGTKITVIGRFTSDLGVETRSEKYTLPDDLTLGYRHF